jgi:hypothetical protein
MYVICHNDFPEFVCALGTTEVQAKEMAALARIKYLVRNPTVLPQITYFHVQHVPVMTHREVVA